MATYSNLKDILTQFEKTVVKGNHYTKSEVDTKVGSKQDKNTYLTQLGTAAAAAESNGVIMVNAVYSSATPVVKVASAAELFNLLFSYNSLTGVLTIIDK